MTDFRRVRCLHAYSGGTVPDSNRVHYSPPIPVEISGTQMQHSIVLYYTTKTWFVNLYTTKTWFVNLLQMFARFFELLRDFYTFSQE